MATWLVPAAWPAVTAKRIGIYSVRAITESRMWLNTAAVIAVCMYQKIGMTEKLKLNTSLSVVRLKKWASNLKK